MPGYLPRAQPQLSALVIITGRVRTREIMLVESEKRGVRACVYTRIYERSRASPLVFAFFHVCDAECVTSRFFLYTRCSLASFIYRSSSRLSRARV